MRYINDQIDNELEITYNRVIVYTEFIVLFFSSLICNLDHGSVPGFSLAIKQNLQIYNLGFGLLGTFVYLGMTLGSLVGVKVF